MQKADFFAVSLAFHAFLLIIALLLPKPFPSVKGGSASPGLTFIEVRAELSPSFQPLTRKERGGIFITPPSPSYLKRGTGGGVTSLPLPHPQGEGWEGGKTAEAPQPPVRHSRESGNRGASQQAQKPAAPPPPPPQPPAGQTVAIAAKELRASGIGVEKNAVSFRYQKGWPPPAMVRLGVLSLANPDASEGWKAAPDESWVILSPASGKTPCELELGVDASALPPGYHEAKVKIFAQGGGKGDEVSVSVMVLPKNAGTTELPHYSWDSYMNGNCKVCHLPENLMPSKGFMLQPEFCGLCHNPAGMANGKVIDGTGHPVLVAAGSGGTKTPTYGTVPTGPQSDRMDTHLRDGKLIVCVTCHNVMEKPGDYGRGWEMASSRDGLTYQLMKGGWAGMGHIVPKVYVTPALMNSPGFLKDAARFLIDRKQYDYDEDEGTVTFKSQRRKDEFVYVTLGSPYLRVTTQNNALCYDCHFENTHEGLNCLACHRMHGTRNIKCISERVRTQDGKEGRVVFRALKGKDSFAGVEGICEVCHPVRHKDGKDYTGSDCLKCHTHKNGFGV